MRQSEDLFSSEISMVTDTLMYYWDWQEIDYFGKLLISMDRHNKQPEGKKFKNLL